VNEKNFKGVDLNLLVVFAVLMRERSTTRAGERLFLSQSAVSHSLKRLRDLLGDELFVRAKQGILPTPRAEGLYRDLMPALDTIAGRLKRRDEFVPSRSECTFRIGLPSALDVCLTPALLGRFAGEAPGVNLVVRPIDFRTGPVMIDREEIDLGLTNLPDIETWHRRQDIGARNYACLFDGKRLGIRAPISLDAYLAFPHVLTSFSGERVGVVDAALAKLGRQRRVVVATADFSSIPFYLVHADAIATLPEYAADSFARIIGLTTSPVPLKLPDFSLSMVWHARLDHDPGHSWFRAAVAEVINGLHAPYSARRGGSPARRRRRGR
jgi:LysR family transcriptional regulator, mexEF-oprN operon transcriptional activator